MTDEVINRTLVVMTAIIAKSRVRATTSLASRILNVQPLESPTGLLAYIRHRYANPPLAKPAPVDYNAAHKVYRHGL